MGKKAKDDEEIRKLTIKATCGMCIGFQRQALKSDLCVNLGKETYSKPCPKFNVDPYGFTFHEDTNDERASIKELTHFIKGLERKECSKLAALLVQEEQTKKYGFRLGQTVYVQIYPGDYLSNWVKAKVIMATKSYIYIQGKSKNFRAMMTHASVQTGKEFKKIMLRLQDNRLLVDPDFEKYTQVRPLKSLMRRKTYQEDVPSIDELGTVSEVMGKTNKDSTTIKEKSVAKKSKTIQAR